MKTNTMLSLKIEVPGIEEKDIDVRIENNTLTVHGERKFEKDEKEENYRRVERQYGSFYRTFTLPRRSTLRMCQANYDEGMLRIQLTKKAEAKPKQIKVNIGSERTLEGKSSQQGRVRHEANASVRREAGPSLPFFYFVMSQSGNRLAVRTAELPDCKIEKSG